MPGPVLLAVEDPSCLPDVEQELRDRYARDCRVICTPSPQEGLMGGCGDGRRDLRLDSRRSD